LLKGGTCNNHYLLRNKELSTINKPKIQINTHKQGNADYGFLSSIFLVPRLCLGTQFWRFRLHSVAEPQRLRYEAEPRNERTFVFFKIDGLVKSQKVPIFAIPAKVLTKLGLAECNNFNTFWMPDRVRHDGFGTSYQFAKIRIAAQTNPYFNRSKPCSFVLHHCSGLLSNKYIINCISLTKATRGSCFPE